MKKQFLILFAFISALALSQVPQRFNKVIVTGDITSPKYIVTNSNNDSVLLGAGGRKSVESFKTDTVSLSNRINAKATGNGTANGTNTGDETLTSIKTKLGAATPVSDGYLRYQDWNTFNSKEPAITKNTAFNKNFGTTTGTVLEGRTFGTAANSAVGDFQPIENQRLSTTNSPSFNTITSTIATGSSPLIINSSTLVNNLNSQYLNSKPYDDYISRFGGVRYNLNNGYNIFGTCYWDNTAIGRPSDFGVLFNITDKGQDWNNQLGFSTDNNIWFRQSINNTDYTGSSWSKLYHSGNLTNTLSTNYIPKWNGSSFVNTPIVVSSNIYTPLSIAIDNATNSTSPTTGALVVNGGVGANHVRANNFYGNGSDLTGVQLPITLTTNGTSGAATFSGNVLNVPNYGGGGVVDQTQTTVNGSTSGTMVCSMPFQTGSYKKVIIYVNSLSGSATYTYPSSFSMIPRASSSLSITAQSTTSITIAGASAIGWCIIEGY